MTEKLVEEPIALESLVGQVADEFLRRQERGERPDVEEYAARYPQAAAVLRKVLAALDLLEQSLVQSAAAAGTSSEAPVTGVLGDFRLLREVGRGGMGVVYEAEQISLKRKVALKVLPFAAALDAKQLQRFKNEAQAAAHLQHPHIVPVHSVGCERGVHFYAMQLIDGHTLAAVIAELRRLVRPQTSEPSEAVGKASAWAEELASGRWAPAQDSPSAGPPTGPYLPAAAEPSALTTTRPVAALSTERSTTSPAFFRTVANLGVQAAEALEHAHQVGIIHRDIKPANLLVDAGGSLWVTDFGLARLGTEAGLTLTGDLLGTLRYMSPEQALAKRAAVDARTDVYSLGVTLYELLTLEAAYNGCNREEVLRQIAFEEPRAPRRLNRAVPPELETIVLKAMSKNPEERYATAQELADDLRRLLDDKPIRARRPTMIQRARKWARRHQALVATAAVALTMLVAVSAVSSVLIWTRYQAEVHQRQRAQTNVRIALDALDKIYLRVAESKFPHDPRRAQEDRELLSEALSFYEQFAGENSADETTRHEVARAHIRLGDIHARFVQTVPAEQAYRQGITLYEQLVVDFPGSPDYRYGLAIGYRVLADLLSQTHRFAEAEQSARQAAARFQELVADLPGVPVYREGLADARNRLAISLMYMKKHDEAQEAYRQALTLWEGLAADFPTNPKYQSHIGGALNNLGMVRLLQDDLPEARGLLEQAIVHQQAALRADPRDYHYRSYLRNHYGHLAETFEKWGKHSEAAEANRQALALAEQLVADFPGVPEERRWVGAAQYGLSLGLQRSGRTEEAEQVLRQAIASQVKLVADSPGVHLFQVDLLHYHNSLGHLFSEGGRIQEAEQIYRETVARCQKLVDDFPDVPDYRNMLGGTLHNVATMCRQHGAFAEARALLEQAIGHQREGLKANPHSARYRPYLRNHFQVLAATLLQLGKHAEAAEAAAELPKVFPESWEEYDRAARFLAKCVPLADKDINLSEAQRKALAQAYADRARELLREAAKRSTNNLEALNNLAWFLATHPDPRIRDPAQGVGLAKRTVELAPEVGGTWNTLGVAHYRAGDWKACIQALEKSMELQKGGDSSDWFFLAMAHAQMGDREEARICYDQAVTCMEKNKPGNSELHHFRAEAAELLGIANK
jgi:serine/threonine protein kinase/tetratricopeptide (TPR) repeat protein